MVPDQFRNSSEVANMRVGGRSFVARSQFQGSNYFDHSKGSRATGEHPFNMSGNKVPGHAAFFRMEEYKTSRNIDEDDAHE